VATSHHADKNGPNLCDPFVRPPIKENREILEARGGIEPPMKVLQTFALPLGYRATEFERS
jgi:hypothetical protein